MSNPFDYPVTVERLPDQLGGGFVAHVPDLPGCMSDGDSPQEAITNARDAIAAWIEAAEELGHPIPDPTPQRAYG